MNQLQYLKNHYNHSHNYRSFSITNLFLIILLIFIVLTESSSFDSYSKDKQDNYPRNLILFSLFKLNVQPSAQLCQDLGTIQCFNQKNNRNQCCQYTPESLSKKIFKLRNNINQFNNIDQNNLIVQTSQQYKPNVKVQIFLNETDLCTKLNQSYCGGSCCLIGGCKNISKSASSLSHMLNYLKELFVHQDHKVHNQQINISSAINNFSSQQNLQQICQVDPPSGEQWCKGVGLLWCDGKCCGFAAVKHKCFYKNVFGEPFIRCPIQEKRKTQQ